MSHDTKNFLDDVNTVIDNLEQREAHRDRIEWWMDRSSDARGTGPGLTELETMLRDEGVLDSGADVTILYGRQIPGLRAENIVYQDVGRYVADRIEDELGMETTVHGVAMTGDAMYPGNPEKASYARLPAYPGDELTMLDAADPEPMRTLRTHPVTLNGTEELLSDHWDVEPGEVETLVDLHVHMAEDVHPIGGDITPISNEIVQRQIDRGEPPRDLWYEDENGQARRLRYNGAGDISWPGSDGVRSRDEDVYRDVDTGDTYHPDVVRGEAWLPRDGLYREIIFPMAMSDSVVYLLRDGLEREESWYPTSSRKVAAAIQEDTGGDVSEYGIMDIHEPSTQVPDEVQTALATTELGRETDTRDRWDHGSLSLSVYPTMEQLRAYQSRDRSYRTDNLPEIARQATADLFETIR